MGAPIVVNHPEAEPGEGDNLDAWRRLDLRALSSFDLFGGVRIRHMQFGESGAPLVFVHGIGNSLNMWVPTAAELAADYRCLLLDLPGFGESEGGFADTSIERVTEVIVDFVAKRCPEARPVIVGHSMGALVSAHVAAVASGSVAAAVNVAGPPLGAITLLDEPIEALREHRSQAFAMSGAMAVGLLPGRRVWIPRLLQSATWRRRLLGGFVYRVDRLDTPLAELLFADLGNGKTVGAARNGRDYEAAAVYPGTAVPVMMIIGERDPITTVEDGRRYLELAGGGELHVLAATAHLPMIERPRLVERLIRSSAPT